MRKTARWPGTLRSRPPHPPRQLRVPHWNVLSPSPRLPFLARQHRPILQSPVNRAAPDAPGARVARVVREDRADLVAPAVQVDDAAVAWVEAAVSVPLWMPVPCCLR